MSKKISQEAKEARNAYYREWRKKNPDKARQYQQKYWMKKAKEMQEQEQEQEEEKENEIDDRLGR